MTATQALLEARARLTPGERRAFAAKINRLIAQTGKLERDGVDRALALLKDAHEDVLDRLRRRRGPGALRPGTFGRRTAVELKREVERRMSEFEAAAGDLLAGRQRDLAENGLLYTRELVRSQGFRPRALGLSRDLVVNAAGRSADLVRSLAASQIGRASDLINRGLISGRSVLEVAQDLDTEFGKGLSRMEAIARTEMLGVYSQTQQAQLDDVARSVPGVRKQWVAVVDERSREGHRTRWPEGAHLQSVPWDDDFVVHWDMVPRGQREEMAFPRDPDPDVSAANIVNCRCTMIPDFSEAKPVPEPGMTEEELPPVRAPLAGLGAKVAARLRREMGATAI